MITVPYGINSKWIRAFPQPWKTHAYLKCSVNRVALKIIKSMNLIIPLPGGDGNIKCANFRILVAYFNKIWMQYTINYIKEKHTCISEKNINNSCRSMVIILRTF